MPASIVVVEFESDKSGIRHLRNKLKDCNGAVFDCLGEPISKDQTKIKQVMYVNADATLGVKKEIDSWLRDQFRVGTTFPKVTIVDSYAGEELYSILKTKGEIIDSQKTAQQNEARSTSLLQEVEAEKSLLAKGYQSVEQAAKELGRIKDLEQRLQVAEAAADKLKDSEAAVEKLQSVCNEYFSQLKAAKKRLDEYEQKPSTPASLHIEAVRSSASALLAAEKELQDIGSPISLDALLNIPESLVQYVVAKAAIGFDSDAAVREALVVKPLDLKEDDRKVYDEARKAVNFYETIKKSNLELPEEIKQTFSQLEETIEGKKAIVSQVEAKQKEYEVACEKTQKLQGLVSNYDLAQKAKAILAKVPKVNMYANVDKNGNATVYVPAGAKDSFAYKLLVPESTSFSVDEHGVMIYNYENCSDMAVLIGDVRVLKGCLEKYLKQVDCSIEITPSKETLVEKK